MASISLIFTVIKMVFESLNFSGFTILFYKDANHFLSGKMSSRYYIVKPEEVISWDERLSKLHGLTYNQLLQLISPNEMAIEFAARYNLISNSMVCKRCGQMMLLWSRNGLDGLQVGPKVKSQ